MSSPVPPSDSPLRADIAARVETAVHGLESLAGSADEFRPGAAEALRAAGLHLLVLPEDRGGLGAGMRESMAVLAAVGAADGSAALGLAMQTHVLGSAVESAAWPPAAFDHLATAVRDDGAFVNAASTEEGTGSPARGGLPDTRAVRSAGGWRVTGQKTFTTWLGALRYALVSARLVEDGIADADDANPVIGNLLVDLESPGVRRVADVPALGMRGSSSGHLFLDDVAVPASLLVFSRRAAEADPRGPSAPSWFAMCLAATYLGVGEGARTAVTRWAVDRRPGDGTTAVGDIPSVQIRLGRLDAALRTARIVVMDVAARWDAAGVAGRRALLADASLAKITATNAAVTATDEALRIAGGPGFLAGPIERAFRDARAGLINPPLDDVAYQGFAKTLVERERQRPHR